MRRWFVESVMPTFADRVPDDEAYDVVIAVADGTIAAVPEIAARLGSWGRPVSGE